VAADLDFLLADFLIEVWGLVVCSGLIACGHDYALKLKSLLPLIQHTLS
jgi:hypothetical protein